MNRRVALLIILFTGSVLFASHMKRKSTPSWVTPPHIQAVLTDSLIVSNDLPRPILDHIRPFSSGTDIVISWKDSMDQVYVVLNELQMTVAFFEVQSANTRNDSISWGFIDANENIAVFTDLVEGVLMEYRLRYYAWDTEGNLLISPWSRAETATQDLSPPEILSFELLNIQDYCTTNPWVIGPLIGMRVQARDVNGQIMQLAIRENSSGIDQTLFDDLDNNPRTNVDTTIYYTLLTEPHQPITLECWVVDVAEHTAEDTFKIQFFYLLSDPKVVCYPNPFLLKNRCTVIKVEKPDVREAKIFDAFGNHIRTLRKDRETDLGFEWDGRNEKGDQVARGGYICIIDGDKDLYCKIAVIR
jgi:hypothetical protein